MAKKKDIIEFNYEIFVNLILDKTSKMSIDLNVEQLKILLLDNRFNDFRFISENKGNWRGIIIFVER